MRVCPECGYREPSFWRVCRWDNPDGELEVCHISDLEFNLSELASRIKNNRGEVIVDATYAYLLGKRAVYVKRIAKFLYEQGGLSAFKVRWQQSKTRMIRDASGYRRKLPPLVSDQKRLFEERGEATPK